MRCGTALASGSSQETHRKLRTRKMQCAVQRLSVAVAPRNGTEKGPLGQLGKAMALRHLRGGEGGQHWAIRLWTQEADGKIVNYQIKTAELIPATQAPEEKQFVGGTPLVEATDMKCWQTNRGRDLRKAG